MKKTIVPLNYVSKLDVYKTQKAICFIKKTFETKLSSSLSLLRVSAPLFVDAKTGLNDNLSGKERPVSFDIPFIPDSHAEVVHSLAKWKRMALHDYDFRVGKGLYTDMNAIRRDETLDNIHSIYVDQWDWEKIIEPSQRTEAYLQEVVQLIVNSIVETLEEVKAKYAGIALNLTKKVKFITSQELLDLYPDKTPKEREYLIAKEYKTVFISQIGKKLSDGSIHDFRAPDYDDWDLNGDIIFFNELLDIPFEVSSMGIRVNDVSLLKQLKESNCLERQNLTYHKMLMENKLPLTIGGGIGQSRLCMLFLEKAHIGEVQSSIWDEETVEACKKGNIKLL
ncbi:MAG: aspartate--ammonia ligase [Bacilli bacterium]|nr:aspartate--ammonia ligase [Bacilli bacterium]